MHRFPIVGWDHFDCIPGTAIEESSVGTFARAFLTTNTEIRIDLNAAERWMVGVGPPKHTGFDRTVLDTCGRAGATSAAISRDREDARLLFALSLAVADRHRPQIGRAHVCTP